MEQETLQSGWENRFASVLNTHQGNKVCKNHEYTFHSFSASWNPEGRFRMLVYGIPQAKYNWVDRSTWRGIWPLIQKLTLQKYNLCKSWKLCYEVNLAIIVGEIKGSSMFLCVQVTVTRIFKYQASLAVL